MPAPIGEGVPQRGDRSARDTHTYADLHASDIEETEHTVHLPLPGEAGGLVRSDGDYWRRVNALAHSELSGVGTDDHHAQAHNLSSETDHPDVENAAKADGYVLVWRSAAGKHVYEEMSSGGSGGSYAATAGYTEDIGDGVNTTYTVTHSLNTWDVIVQVYDTDATPTEQVGATIKLTSADAITVTFESAPAADQYRVLVLSANVGIANTLTIEEVDGTPSVAADTLIVPNGSLTDNADGSVTLDIAATITDHDHSGDPGDGGTFDAANLTSGAATDGQVLTADGAGGAAWEDAATGGGDMTNPMTAAEDLIVGGVDGAPGRLVKGTDGQVLKMVAGAVAWGTDETSAGGGADEFTDLTDAPASYVGQGGKYVAVKATEDGLEFL